MKQRHYAKSILGFLVLVLIASGCKKDDPAPEFQELGFDSQEVIAKLASGLVNSTDDHAQDCVDWIESVVDMSSFIDNMEVPEDAQKSAKKSALDDGDTWSWTWAYGGESFTFYWTYGEGSTSVTWPAA